MAQPERCSHLQTFRESLAVEAQPAFLQPASVFIVELDFFSWHGCLDGLNVLNCMALMSVSCVSLAVFCTYLVLCLLGKCELSSSVTFLVYSPCHTQSSNCAIFFFSSGIRDLHSSSVFCSLWP